MNEWERHRKIVSAIYLYDCREFISAKLSLQQFLNEVEGQLQCNLLCIRIKIRKKVFHQATKAIQLSFNADGK